MTDETLPKDPFHSAYRSLSEQEIETIRLVKDYAGQLYVQLENALLLGADPRCIATAKTNLEQSVMWAVKGITA